MKVMFIIYSGRFNNKEKIFGFGELDERFKQPGSDGSYAVKRDVIFKNSYFVVGTTFAVDEIIPEEIYNSTLYKLMQENE